jgi:hypothetical protein
MLALYNITYTYLQGECLKVPANASMLHNKYEICCKLNLATMKAVAREKFVTFDFSMLVSHEIKGNAL